MSLPDLPLFAGPHVPLVRYARALEDLDLAAAAPDAPPGDVDGVRVLLGATRERGRARRLAALHRAPRPEWTALLTRAALRLLARELDATDPPGCLEGNPAGAFYLRADEPAEARLSLSRHLDHHPGDARAWAHWAALEPIPGAARHLFHGGTELEVPAPLADVMADDDLEPSPGWALAYAFLCRFVAIGFVRDAVRASPLAGTRPVPLPGRGDIFALYLVEAVELAAAEQAAVHARAQLKRVSPAAFRRYLQVVAR